VRCSWHVAQPCEACKWVIAIDSNSRSPPQTKYSSLSLFSTDLRHWICTHHSTLRWVHHHNHKFKYYFLRTNLASLHSIIIKQVKATSQPHALNFTLFSLNCTDWTHIKMFITTHLFYLLVVSPFLSGLESK